MVGQTIVLCRLSAFCSSGARQTTKGDGLSHLVRKRPIPRKGIQAHRVSLWLVRSLLAYSMLLLAAAQPRSLLAQYQKYEGQPVVNIRFEPAVQPLEGAELFEMRSEEHTSE